MFDNKVFLSFKLGIMVVGGGGGVVFLFSVVFFFLSFFLGIVGYRVNFSFLFGTEGKLKMEFVVSS